MNIHLLTPHIPTAPDSPLRVSLDLLDMAARRKGHTLHIIETSQCKMYFDKKPVILVDNKKPKINILITKPSFSGKNLDVHASVIRQFELGGIPTINSYHSIVNSKNKVRMLQKLTSKGIPIPKTYVVRSSEYVSEISEQIGSFPVIIKSVFGSGGIGVGIIESKRGLKTIIEMMIEDNDSTPLIIQHYVRESRGKDIRVFVVGNKIVAAMDRIATKKGEFRSNFSIGGKVKIASLSEEEKKLAKRAAKAMHLEFAGVDIIRSKEGPKVLEVNSNPGLQGITQATGVDVAGAIIDYAMNKAKELGRE
ncbi:MAG: RimK family alpha-L-glutamate ligase [Candidatus Magasanikbacteria bacterium]|nr:RimK family alpha-L-glutamate ligase [Candidatus Magasanikbacteria bacterium]